MTRLIIVDDENMILNSLSRYVREQLPDFEVCGCFYDGQEALDYLLEHPVDIVLSDICMPRMNGLELAREISNRMPHCVMIILSGFSEFEYAQNAIKYNVFNYMLKPVDYRELKKVLLNAQATAASRRKAVSPDLTDESTEMFFVDLFCGSIFSAKELKDRFLALNFPFSLDNSQGYLVKISLRDVGPGVSHDYEIDRMIFSLKNALTFSIPDTYFYFMRKATNDYYYIAVSSRRPEATENKRLSEKIREFLALECSVDLYHPFTSFHEFIQKKKPAAAPHEGEKPSNDAQIQKAIDYINANYAQDLSRETVASAVYLSPSHFSYLFKQSTGVSFIDYLTTVRMQNSVELLKTRMRINDVAEKVGYQNRNRFSINFRQYTGYTPTEYRRQVLSMEDMLDEE